MTMGWTISALATATGGGFGLGRWHRLDLSGYTSQLTSCGWRYCFLAAWTPSHCSCSRRLSTLFAICGWKSFRFLVRRFVGKARATSIGRRVPSTSSNYNTAGLSSSYARNSLLCGRLLPALRRQSVRWSKIKRWRRSGRSFLEAFSFYNDSFRKHNSFCCKRWCSELLHTDVIFVQSCVISWWGNLVETGRCVPAWHWDRTP